MENDHNMRSALVVEGIWSLSRESASMGILENGSEQLLNFSVPPIRASSLSLIRRHHRRYRPGWQNGLFRSMEPKYTCTLHSTVQPFRWVGDFPGSLLNS